MGSTTQNPAALVGSGDRAGGINGFAAYDISTNTPEEIAAQAAVIIASRFHLSPVRARLVCDLAGIGRAA